MFNDNGECRDKEGLRGDLYITSCMGCTACRGLGQNKEKTDLPPGSQLGVGGGLANGPVNWTRLARLADQKTARLLDTFGHAPLRLESSGGNTICRR
jgi:hypothetical protein